MLPTHSERNYESEIIPMASSTATKTSNAEEHTSTADAQTTRSMSGYSQKEHRRFGVVPNFKATDASTARMFSMTPLYKSALDKHIEKLSKSRKRIENAVKIIYEKRKWPRRQQKGKLLQATPGPNV
jgi:hypothetical protein